MVNKSLIAIQPMLAQHYAQAFPYGNDGFQCFEVLGYDVMLDAKLKPWIIEVNHSPSFCTDTPLDLAVKKGLIADTMNLVRPDPIESSRSLSCADLSRITTSVVPTGAPRVRRTGATLQHLYFLCSTPHSTS